MMLQSDLYYRSSTTVLMVLAFALVLSSGESVIAALLYSVEARVFHELMQVPLLDDLIHKKRQAINWFLYIIASAWILGEIVQDTVHLPLVRLLSTLGYSTWLAAYIATLDVKLVRDEVLHMAWLQFCVSITSLQTFFLFRNLQQGLIWFLLPTSLVIFNDIAAYVCGRVFGKTKLVDISPRKTVEGFLGAIIMTVLFGYRFSQWLTQFDYMIVPHARPLLLQWMQDDQDTMGSGSVNNMHVHGVILALYASVAAPFGGFLASSIKRACSKKDFAQLIPGHGGMTDRMDCHLLMGLFTFVYYRYAVNDQQ
ncbi:phosphatidate cytidylyltransferase [Radiomyces spectabilis]|uniref:phosphatidate cytidylyltransferase n=1 Tax=Radiomyces spectabilis TaxID=64574 RepID=UPI00221ECF5D|nr:phosphatidate cytidylyltransferase [Radiomyces spectabilis]KAI8391014.1 phosphatidate cytidylyltransferase [Radiomyces spectabilis]